jgi:predicted PurR-regulated permease PerM
MKKTGLEKTLQILLVLILSIAALHFAQPFLVPVILAGLFSMLFLPLCRKLERSGLPRSLSVLGCILLFLGILAGIGILITWQISNLTQDLGNIEEKVRSAWRHLSDYIAETFGISRIRQEEVLEEQSKNAGGGIAKISAILMDVIVNFILMIVYIFLFLYYRSRIKTFILRIIPKKENANVKDAIDSIEDVSLKYLSGMGIMIVCLWIMYSIGFSLLGLKNAFFFAIMCGLFEIVPFIGNFVGNLLAVLMAVTQGGGAPMIIGILITYAIIQFIQTYVLEPLVVGTEVDINPLFTILGLVVGELIWGISGLVLAIPLMGIAKIVFDHIPSLQPYGQLMGKEKKKGKGIHEKVARLFSKKK